MSLMIGVPVDIPDVPSALLGRASLDVVMIMVTPTLLSGQRSNKLFPPPVVDHLFSPFEVIRGGIPSVLR